MVRVSMSLCPCDSHFGIRSSHSPQGCTACHIISRHKLSWCYYYLRYLLLQSIHPPPGLPHQYTNSFLTHTRPTIHCCPLSHRCRTISISLSRYITMPLLSSLSLSLSLLLSRLILEQRTYLPVNVGDGGIISTNQRPKTRKKG